MGIDYGDVRVGIAVSDDLGMTAQAIDVLRNDSRDRLLDRIAELARARNIEGLVVGLPRNMNGTYGERATRCEAFAEDLRTRLGLPVELWDERLSSMAAERVLLEADVSRKKRRQVIDKMAAAVILQSFMDAKR